MLHSSATGRRHEQTLPEAPGPRQALHPRACPPGIPGAGFVLAQEFEGVMT